MWVPIAILVASYLWGAIPSAYLVARYVKGIDIREYGSGNAGATNVMTYVGKWTGLLLGAFDCLGKGVLPVVAANLLGQPLAVQVGAGLIAIVGHNWSPYMQFTGGRGVATAIGVLVGFLMWQELLIIGVFMGLLGRIIFKDTGFWTFISLLALPALAFAFGRPPELVYMSIAIGGLLIFKRLTANWEEPSSGQPLVKVVLYRVLWDRDVHRRQEWTQRRPVENQEQSTNVADEILP